MKKCLFVLICAFLTISVNAQAIVMDSTVYNVLIMITDEIRKEKAQIKNYQVEILDDGQKIEIKIEIRSDLRSGYRDKIPFGDDYLYIYDKKTMKLWRVKTEKMQKSWTED